MAIYYFDTSALVKRYVIESGSAWVSGLTDPSAGHYIFISHITAVELVSAVARRQRSGTISASDATRFLSDLRHHIANQYLVEPVTAPLLDHAMNLAEQHAVRGADAIRLATALFVSAYQAFGYPMTLISADLELNAAAVAEGLAVDDPNSHP